MEKVKHPCKEFSIRLKSLAYKIHQSGDTSPLLDAQLTLVFIPHRKVTMIKLSGDLYATILEREPNKQGGNFCIQVSLAPWDLLMVGSR